MFNIFLYNIFRVWYLLFSLSLKIHILLSHMLSSLNFENVEIVYSNAVSPLFSYPLHLKKKKNFYIMFGDFIISFIVKLYPLLPEFFCTCTGQIFFLSSVYHFSLLLHSVKILAKHFSDKYFVISEIYFMISCCYFQVLFI